MRRIGEVTRDLLKQAAIERIRGAALRASLPSEECAPGFQSERADSTSFRDDLSLTSVNRSAVSGQGTELVIDGPGLIPAGDAFSGERSVNSMGLCLPQCAGPRDACNVGSHRSSSPCQHDERRTPVVTPADLTLERTSIRAAVEPRE